jgi:hypothetical protein
VYHLQTGFHISFVVFVLKIFSPKSESSPSSSAPHHPLFAKSHFATWGMSIMPDGQQLSAIERFTTASNPASPKTSLELDGTLH